MATYRIGTGEYNIPDTVQGAELEGVISSIAAQEKQTNQMRYSEPDVSFSDRLSRGVDTLQSTGGRAIQAVGELVGSEDIARTGEDIALSNKAEADATAPEPDNFFEILQESIPSLGAVGAGAAGGAVVGSIVPGAGTVAGALAGGLLASFGLNVGDVKDIQEAIGEATGDDTDFGMKHLAIAGAATLPDVLFGKIATDPLKRAGIQEAKKAIKDGTKKALLKKAGVTVAKDTGIGAGAAGTSAGILMGGTALAEGGSELVVEMADAISETIVNAVGLGGALGLSVSGAGHIPVAKELAADINVPGIFKRGDDVVIQEPNPEAVSNLKHFSKKGADFISSVAGKATDPLMRSYGDNPYIRRIVGDIVQRPEMRKERVQMAGKKDAFGDTFTPSTMSNDAAKIRADLLKGFGYSELRRMSAAERKAVLDAKSKGMITDPVVAKLHQGFRDALTLGRKAGKTVGDLGDTYIPFFLDRSKFTNKLGVRDPLKIREFVSGALTDMYRSGKLTEGDTKAVQAMRGRLEQYVEDTYAGGTARLGDDFNVSSEMLDTIYAAESGSAAALKKLGDPLISKQDVNIRKSNLDTHRELSDLSQEFLNTWSKEQDILDILENYADLVSLSVAASNKFGKDGSKLSRNIRLAVADGLRTGNRIKPQDIAKIVDVANVAQKLTIGNRTPEEKATWRALRGLSNALSLQGAALSSLMEPYFIIPKAGAKATVSGLARAIRSQVDEVSIKFGKSIEDMPHTERTELLEELGISMREGLSTAAAKIGEDALGVTTMEHAVMKWSGLAPWTMFTKQWASFAMEDAIISTARKLSTETNPKKIAKLQDKLFEAGLDPDRTVAWVKEGASRSDDYFQTWVRDGIRTLVRDVLILPEQQDLPLWTSDPRATVFSNLKSFSLAFNNTIGRQWLKSLQEAGQSPGEAFKTAATIGLAIPMFMLLDGLKAASKGDLDEWQDKDTSTVLLSSMGRLGGGGLIMDPFLVQGFGKSPAAAYVSPVADVMASPVHATVGVYEVLTGQEPPEKLVEDVLKTITKTTPHFGLLPDD